MVPEYRYQCRDYSIVTPPFKKWIVRPLMRFVPFSVPANIITIVSNIFLYVSLALALVHRSSDKYHFILIPVLIFLYALGDHVDGMQAGRTGTSSALGEFCDHYLDVFNNGILIMIILLLFEISNIYVASFLFFSSYLAHSAVLYEEFKTGWLVFEKYGSLEAILLVLLLILTGFFDRGFSTLMFETFRGLSLLECLLILSCFGALGTFARNLKRVGEISGKFAGYCLFLCLITIFCFLCFGGEASEKTASSFLFPAGTGPLHLIFLLITLYGSEYSGRLMRGHLVDRVERHADFLAPFIAIISIIYLFLSKKGPVPFNVKFTGWVFFLLSGYLFVMIAILVFKVFYPLRSRWVWRNVKGSLPTSEVKNTG